MAKILETETTDGYSVVVSHEADDSIGITGGFSSSALNFDAETARKLADAILDALPGPQEG